MIRVIHGEIWSEDFTELNDLIRDFQSCIRFCYNRFYKEQLKFNDVRKAAKLKYPTLNTRQISDAVLQGQTQGIPQVKNDKILILMRGFPGSGKSSKVQALLRKYRGTDGHVVSIDHAWIPETRKRRLAGEYVSPKDELEEYDRKHPRDDQGALMSAIKRTHQEFYRLVDQGVTPIIVDDTNIMSQYMRPYAKYANEAGYKIKIEYPDTPWWKEFASRLNKPPAERGEDFEELVRQMNELGNKGGRLDDILGTK